MAGAAAVQIGSAVYDRLDIFSEISIGIEAFLKERLFS